MSPLKSVWFCDSQAAGSDEPGAEDSVELVRQLRRGSEAAAAWIPEERRDVVPGPIERAIRHLESGDRGTPS